MARHFDSLGAVTVTASLMLLVFGLTQANRVGWASAQTIGVFAASAVLMAFFLWNETRSRSPLVPLSIFKRRTLTGANVIGFGLGTVIFGMFFLLSLYMQQVLGLLGDADRLRLPRRRAHGHRRRRASRRGSSRSSASSRCS